MIVAEIWYQIQVLPLIDLVRILVRLLVVGVLSICTAKEMPSTLEAIIRLECPHRYSSVGVILDAIRTATQCWLLNSVSTLEGWSFQISKRIMMAILLTKYSLGMPLCQPHFDENKSVKPKVVSKHCRGLIVLIHCNFMKTAWET